MNLTLRTDVPVTIAVAQVIFAVSGLAEIVDAKPADVPEARVAPAYLLD